MPSPVWNVPNLLSLSRIPLAALLGLAIGADWWIVALVTFVVAAITDWLDGWWARRFDCQSDLGRSLDPLTDKVLIATGFIFLIPAAGSGIQPWMVAVVVVREVLITGLRGMVEAQGQSFGADWFGKLKTVLQCAVLIGVLLVQVLRSQGVDAGIVSGLDLAVAVVLYAMLAATVGSAVQYVLRGLRLIGSI